MFEKLGWHSTVFEMGAGMMMKYFSLVLFFGYLGVAALAAGV